MPRLHQRNKLRATLLRATCCLKHHVACSKLLVAGNKQLAARNMMLVARNKLRVRNKLRWCKRGTTD